MTLLPERILSGEVEAPDLFCGGTPCQAFSVAGLRNSLDDARGNLSLTFVGIANAIDHVRSVRGDAPAIIFWENVPGVLSTKDNAFGCFLAALAGESDPVTCPDGKWSTAGVVVGQTRTVAWRVLDAQYFGVAQRRRRVFVVASARDDFDPAEILFEFDSVRRDTAPSRETGQGVAASIESGATVSDYDVAGTLDKGVPRRGIGHNGNYDSQVVPVAKQWAAEITSSLCAADGPKGVSDQYAHEGKLIALASGQGGAEIGIDRCPTLTCLHEAPIAAYSVAQPIPIHDQATRHAGRNGEKTMGKGNGLGIGQAGEPMNTLTKGDRHAVAQPIAFSGQMSNPHTDVDIMQTLQAKNPMAVAWSMNLMSPGRQIREDHGVGALTQDAHRPTQGNEAVVIQQSMAVRRLTPVECERLQGFPDSYTDIKAKGKPTPDGPRYKALGNSWAVPVVAWIGERIAQGLESTSQRKTPDSVNCQG
jgi:DNA (cytosine-5)-methyltransferase 1